MKSKILAFLALCLVAGPAAASVVAFTNQATFVSATGASLATLPNTENVALITVAGRLSIDHVGVGGMWSGAGIAPFLSQSDKNFLVASGTEDFDITTLASTYAFGFSLYEPTSGAPQNGCNGICAESTFLITLHSGATVVDSFSIEPANNTFNFYGYWSSAPITAVTIRETVGTSDNEFFGRFYTGATAYSPSDVPLPAAAWLLLSGLAGLGLNVRRKSA
jgi:hypothetical protein